LFQLHFVPITFVPIKFVPITFVPITFVLITFVPITFVPMTVVLMICSFRYPKKHWKMTMYQIRIKVVGTNVVRPKGMALKP
jgi:hypothetical protein